MNKWVISFVVFTGFICFSSGGNTKNKKETKEHVNIRFNLGTKHFIDKHYSAPPKEDGIKTGDIATQIVGSVGKKWFVNGDTEAKAVRARNKINENKEKIGLTFTAKVQDWRWDNDKRTWTKRGNQENKAGISIMGIWEDDGDFVSMTWDTGYGK